MRGVESRSVPNRNGAITSAVLVHLRVDRPTSTGAGGSDPRWLCGRGKPGLAIRKRGCAASKKSQLEQQLILGQLPGRRKPFTHPRVRALAWKGSALTWL